jgi:ABC-type phosphate/phosphonate transport system ATPase subunit
VGASSSEIRAIRSEVGMIFQTFNLVNRSRVINNALMGRLSRIPRSAYTCTANGLRRLAEKWGI